MQSVRSDNLNVWDWRGYITKYAPDNSTLKLVLHTLSVYMNSVGGSCFPSIDTICKDASLSKPSVIKYLDMAEKEGWIIKSKMKLSGSRWNHNSYQAAIPQRVVKLLNHNSDSSKTDENQSKPTLPREVKPVNSNTPNNSSSYNTSSIYAFEEFWNDYEKKKGRKKCESKWRSLSEPDRKSIKEFIPVYKQYEPNKKYRKHPYSFLNSEIWKDDWSEYSKPKNQLKQKRNGAISYASKGDKHVEFFYRD